MLSIGIENYLKEEECSNSIEDSVTIKPKTYRIEVSLAFKLPSNESKVSKNNTTMYRLITLRQKRSRYQKLTKLAKSLADNGIGLWQHSGQQVGFDLSDLRSNPAAYVR